METKILLRLIKDDLLQLKGLTDAFGMDSLPGADEVELSLVRAKALFRQLELLHKSIVQAENQRAAAALSDQKEVVFSEVPEAVKEEAPAFSEPIADKINVQPDESTVEPDVFVVQETALPADPEIAPKESAQESLVIQTESVDLGADQQATDWDETLAEPEKNVNDLFAQEKSESAFQAIPIRSIWDGIGINDRFLFVRELFGNNTALYEQTVTSLNQLTTIQEAVTYLKMNFKWQKSEASLKFLNLVKRRFTN